MSLQELEVVRSILRETDLALAGPVDAARANFEAMLAAAPLDEAIAFEETTVGGVPALRATPPGASEERVMLYLHGGAFVIGSAHGYRAFWSGLARDTGVTGIAVDYRLAPEHPFPAAVDDALAAYRALLDEGRRPGQIVVAGDSAGGGLAASLLVAARDAGLPMPAGALLLSPWADLRCDAPSYESKAAEDLSLTPEDLRASADRYLNGADPAEPLASPVEADLSGLPPLLITVGSCEILLDDAVRLAARAGHCGVRVTLDVWPQMPHVWQSFAFMLSEGAEASLDATQWLARRLEEEDR